MVQPLRASHLERKTVKKKVATYVKIFLSSIQWWDRGRQESPYEVVSTSFVFQTYHVSAAGRRK